MYKHLRKKIKNVNNVKKIKIRLNSDKNVHHFSVTAGWFTGEV